MTAGQLLQLTLRECRLHNIEGAAYVSCPVLEGRESVTVEVRSQGFVDWLTARVEWEMGTCLMQTGAAILHVETAALRLLPSPRSSLPWAI